MEMSPKTGAQPDDTSARGSIKSLRSVRSRATLFVCLIAVSVAACILVVDHFRVQRIAYEKADLTLNKEMSYAAADFIREYENVTQDALMLAGTPPISGIARSLAFGGFDPAEYTSTIEWREQLEQIFIALMRHRPDYRQVRLIGFDDHGREIARVNRDGDSLRIVPTEGLQRKSGESYFSTALETVPGEVGFSRVTLNREHGRITLPPTAVTRAVAPVADGDGRPFGFIVVNADYQTLLARALDRLNLSQDIYVTDSQGNYIFRKHGEPTSPLVFTETGDYGETPETTMTTVLIDGLKAGAAPDNYMIGDRPVRAFHRQIALAPNDPNATLGITLVQDRDTVLAEVNDGNRVSLLLSLLLVTVVTLITFRATRSITAPLGEIIAGIRAYSDKKERSPLPTARDDELGELSRSFEALVGRLDTAERARSRTTRRLEAITENSIDGMFAIDSTGSIIDYNKACETILGYTAEEAIGRNFSLFMPDDTAPHHDGYPKNDISRNPRDIAGTTRNLVARHKNGRDVPIELSISEIRLSDTEVIYSGLLRDISDRIRYETALAESEETFRRVMHDGPTGMALVRPDGSWIDINQALCDLLGYSREELLQTHFKNLTHPDDDGIVEPVREKLADGSLANYRFEKRYIHKSGRTVWAYLTVSSMRLTGSSEAVLICHLTDITDRKRMEEMKNEFISVVSHELRTPLTSIRGSLGLILGTMKAELSPALKQLVTIAHANCERLIPLINDILDLDKLAAGKMRFEMETISVDDAIRKAIETNAPYAEKYGVAIVGPDATDNPTVFADPERTQQVLSNLLSNASKFTPEGGTITVKAETEEDVVRISVVDEGDGVPEDFADKIFSKFSQADASVTRSTEGTGLGLHITKQIVEQMGGRIGFDSVTGVGATFWFELPVQPAIRPAGMAMADTDGLQEAIADGPPDDRGYAARILHVEDDRDFSRMLKAFIPTRYSFENASSLADARHALVINRYDLVILDPSLLDGNALELLGRRGGPIPRDTPVIVLSADSLPERVRSLVNAAFVKSQISEEALKGEILSYLQHTEERMAHA